MDEKLKELGGVHDDELNLGLALANAPQEVWGYNKIYRKSRGLLWYISSIFVAKIFVRIVGLRRCSFRPLFRLRHNRRSSTTTQTKMARL
jgi:hypothetical protein